MFGNFGFGGISFRNMNFTSEAIDKKLSEPNTPLEDLLVEDELLQELRSQNKKLLNYLDKNKVKQMIDYITKEPLEDDQLKGHKFPFVCSQLFNVEETKIMNFFLKTNKELESINKAEMTNKDINSSKDMVDIYKDKNSNDKNNNNDDNEEEDDYGQDKINLFNKIDNLKKDDENDVVASESKNENKDENLKENKDNENKNEEENKNENKDNEKKKEEENKNENKEKVNMINLNKDERTINNRYNEEKKKIENKKEDTYPENGIELLDYLLNFLLNEKDLNYVLCGYFESLINNILNINSKQFITYLYTEKKDILKNFVYHSYRKSIAEALSKILQFEKYFKEDTYGFTDEENNNKENNQNNEDLKEMELVRKNILELIFDKIDINMDTEKLNSFSHLINELIETKEIFDEIISNKKIIDNLIIKQFTNLNLINSENNQKRNFVIIIDIIISWLKKIEDNNKPLIVSRESNDEDLVEQKNAQPQIKHTIISQALYEILPNLITVNFNKKDENDNKENKDNNILESYNDFSLKPLGIYRTKIVELIGNMLQYCKNISQSFDVLLINNHFFENAFYYLFLYEWNNLYQDSLLALFKKFLTDSLSHELLADFLFIKLDIINIISSHFSLKKEENKFTFLTTKNTINHGYEAFLVSLAYKINSVVGGEPLKIVGRSREGSISFINKNNNDNNLNSAMNAIYSGAELFDELMAAEESSQKKSINEKDIGFMKKYLTEKWKNFFSENVVEKVKLYEKKLCEEERKKSDLFDQFDNDDNKDNDFEDLLGVNKKHKSRDDDFFGEGDDDEKDNEDDWGKDRKSSNENKFNEEVDINEFDFVNEGSNDENENSQKMVVDELDNVQENSNYNDVNYWKNNVQGNEYMDKIGEEAMKDLL